MLTIAPLGFAFVDFALEPNPMHAARGLERRANRAHALEPLIER